MKNCLRNLDSMTASTFLFLISGIFLYSEAIGQVHRKLIASLNPDCEEYNACDSAIDILYVKATGHSDVLHYLLSTLGGVPSTLIVKTSLNDQLKINWSLLLNDSVHAISFSKEQFSYGLILKQVWQFDDANNTGYMEEQDISMPLDIADFIWSNVTYTSEVPDMIIASFNTLNGTNGFSANGSLTVKVCFSGTSKYDDDFPHLKYTSNSTQLSFTFDRMVSYLNSTRLALEFIAISHPNDEDWKEEKTKSIDDEYTPGVFTSYQMTVSGKSGNEAFLFWKPLAYTSPDHTVMNSTDVVLYDITNDTDVPYCLAYVYFNDTNVHKASWHLSFGAAGDGFYAKTNYSVWSVMTGLGQPPPDEISEVAIIFIAVGLGAPTILILSGATYLVWKRLSRKEDDLLLSRYSIQ